MKRILSVGFRSLAALIIVAVITPVASAGVMLGSYLFLPLPAQIPEAKAPESSQVTRVLDAQGNQVAVFRTFETSIPVKPKDIPKHLKQAVVAAEDKSFYKHGGVDLRGTIRALWADIRSGQTVQGGSTITQQLVKNSYTNDKSRTVSRKIREAIVAAQLDRASEKDEILFQYLSVIYLGEGAYGVGAAAETYFHKRPQELSISESALLAGIIPAPSRYSPRVNPDLADQKRRGVLKKMLSQHLITPTQFDQAVRKQVWLKSEGPPPKHVTFVYPPLTQTTTQPFFTDYVRQFLSTRLPGGEKQIRTGGLTIHTTLDPTAQFLANQEVREQIEGVPDAGVDPLTGRTRRFQMAMVSVDPPTGYVRSMVGGRNYQEQSANLALGGCPKTAPPHCVPGGGTGRQPGSSFKPFVLATAFNQGLTPEKVYSGASPHVVGTDQLQNYGGGSYGYLSLRSATQESVNTVFSRLILDVGVENTMNNARAMGMHIPKYDGSKYGASVALGALEVSPLDMASAYGVFAFRGLYHEPTPVTYVQDRKGKVILDFRVRTLYPKKTAKRVLREDVADNVTNVLQGVLISGTAGGKGLTDRPSAGKTGTAQDNKDAWFIGYTPDISTAVWMGYDPGYPMHGIHGVGSVVGGSLPASSWHDYMTAVFATEKIKPTKFTEPAPIRFIRDDYLRKRRRGFDAGITRYPSGGAEGGPYVIDYAPLEPAEPTTTTSTSSTTSTSTSTTTTTFKIN